MIFKFRRISSSLSPLPNKDVPEAVKRSADDLEGALDTDACLLLLVLFALDEALSHRRVLLLQLLQELALGALEADLADVNRVVGVGVGHGEGLVWFAKGDLENRLLLGLDAAHLLDRGNVERHGKAVDGDSDGVPLVVHRELARLDLFSSVGSAAEALDTLGDAILHQLLLTQNTLGFVVGICLGRASALARGCLFHIGGLRATLGTRVAGRCS